MVTKLLEVFTVRKLGKLINASSKPHVVINSLTPGACYSDFMRDEVGMLKGLVISVLKYFIARSTEAGSRTLMAAAKGGEETHGRFMADCHISRFVRCHFRDCGAFSC